MKSLKQYIAESAKEYEFRFKTIVELSEEQLDKFETHLRKYDAFDVGAPKRTILQTAPLDFYNTGATEVYMIDFKTRIPTSAAVLGNELGQCLQLVSVTLDSVAATSQVKYLIVQAWKTKKKVTKKHY